MRKIDLFPILIGLPCTLLTTHAFGAEGESLPLWDTVMLIIVFLTLTSSAALTIAAWRQWRRGWRLVAAFPIAILVLWSGGSLAPALSTLLRTPFGLLKSLVGRY